MPKSIAEKLRIADNMTLLTIHAPEYFGTQLQPPANVCIVPESSTYDQVHWFVTNKAQLDKEVEDVVKMIKPGNICWVYYPKGTSKVQTDLTRDRGWDALLKHQHLQWISLISFDETWSVFGFRLKTEADRKKEATKPPREIFNYIDPVKKIVNLPDDLAAALNSDNAAKQFFDQLSFSNRKEYVEWIITAKREETRKQRIAGTIERLHKQWKNPRNM